TPRSKSDFSREGLGSLLKMLDALAPGDVVTVMRIDRLARSTFDLFEIVKRAADTKAQFLLHPQVVGRHRHQHRALDPGHTRRPGRRGVPSYPPPHRRRPEPRQGPRKSHGPSPFPHTGTEEEAIRRRAQGATLEELAHSYNVRRATISRLG